MNEAIIGLKTRQAFREYMVGWVLREIADEFGAARIDCSAEYQPQIGGQRRTLIEQYYHTIDWARPSDIKRVLSVFESVLYQLDELVEDPPFPGSDSTAHKRQLNRLTHSLALDGFRWTDGRIVPMSGLDVLSPVKDAAVAFDAQHMAEQIKRMEAAVESDPSLAIGTAKELIETCCKTILAERGKPPGESADVSTLTKATLKELKLVPDDIPDAARGRDVIKRILSNLGTIGHGLAELRGLYGTGHGKHGRVSGLSPRHAKLAVGAAATLVTFLFETHQEQTR